MNRARASVPPEAIRIEDEVWQEAFRERPRSRPRLRSLDGGRSPERGRLPERARSPERVAVAGARPVPRRVSGALTGRSPVPVDAPVPADAPVPVIAVEPPTMAPSETQPGNSSPSTWAAPEPPGRRTITITGRGAERNLPVPSDASRRRAARKVHER